MRALLVAIAVLVVAAPTAQAAGTKITAAPSDFGTMLWGPNRQAIYVFDKDARNKTNCRDECAQAWPPVYTSGKPVAGKGAKASLLGSIRRGSRRQVTYRGRPLYYYAHEGAGEVRCHNVFLNGGNWWVIGADGRRRP
jgi:predicted lipoprotein with Yx(FWY)xxD motif